jgi:phosphate-selective porin OprO/OprP
MKAAQLAALAWSLTLLVLAGSVRGQDNLDQKLTPEERAELRQLIREEIRAEEQANQQVTQPAEEKKDESSEAKPTATGVFNNGLYWKSADGAFAFHVGGRLEWDNAWFTQNDNLLIGPAAGTRFQDGNDFRRARLRADGTVWNNIDFVCEVNFASIQDVSNVNNSDVQVGSVGLDDFHLTFREVPIVGNVRVGHFVAPFGLERFTSANYFPYMERSSIDDAFWGPNQRQGGIYIFNGYFDDRLTTHAAFTRIGKSDEDTFAFGAEDGRYAGGVRVTGLPVYLDDGRILVHLGADYFHQTLADNTLTVANRLPLRAGAGSTQVPNLLATGTFFTPNGGNIASIEGAMIAGPFSLSAEYAVAWTADVFENFDGVNFTGPRGNVSYSAFYVETGCFLTPGDRRRFDRKSATWDRSVPEVNALGCKDDEGHWCFGRGAVELLARLSYLDLESGSPTLTPTSSTAGARAGRQRDLTLGVNWYLNSQTRFMVNYVWTHLDSVVAGASGDIQGLGVRMHFDF